MAEEQTQRQRYLRRRDALKREQSTWVPHWQELSDYIQPRRARFLTSDRNVGTKANQNIINSTPMRALRVLASGMMAGITSPARPWFRLTTPDSSLAEVATVREWLHSVEQTIFRALAKSNFYHALHAAYEGLGTFGTTAVLVEEDFEDGIRAYALPIGSYYLANSARLRVDTIYRDFSMTVGQMAEQFGVENCSDLVKQSHREGHFEKWIDVLHIIEPNKSYKPGKLGPAGMGWTSCWVEPNASPDSKPLRESGYEEFPVLAPRWMVTGEDVYGTSPGMEALGDARALQELERQKGRAVDKIIDPPMSAPGGMRGQRASLLPAAMNYIDNPGAGQTFQPSVIVPPVTVQIVDSVIRQHETRIQQQFFADVWLSMTASDSGPMTAREVAERHEEKMLQLGPVTERLQDELLDPAIDRVFGILLRRGEIPPPPEELQGLELKVEYISIMAQAQRLLGISAIERLASFVGNIAAVPQLSSVVDKLNVDQMVDEYGIALGTAPSLVRSDEEVDAIRQARAQQQQQAAQMEQAAALTQGAKTLSETDMNGDNALKRLVDNLGGVAAASAGRPH